jgi:hypothetical protein
LGRGLLHWEPRKICFQRVSNESTIGPGDGASLSIRILMRDVEKGGTFTRNSERYKRLCRRASLSSGALLGNLRSLLTDYERKYLGISIPLYGGSVGQTGLGSSTVDFERRMKGVWWCGVSLWELCEGNLEGGPSCWGP